MAVRAVFFDLDDTLVRDGAEEAVRRTARALAARHGFGADDILAANVEAWQQGWASLGDSWMRGRLSDDALPRDIWRRTLERYGQGDRSLVDEAVDLHLSAERVTFTPFEETAEVLDALRARGVAVGLITNGPAQFQRGKLAAAGIRDRFDLVVTSGDLGILKPDVEVFRHALAGLDADAGGAVHVGDDFAADVEGAVRAGMQAVWVNRTGAAPPKVDVPHHDGRSLRDVLAVVGEGGPSRPR